MSYNVHFQTNAAYKSVKYGQGTVYSSGCGPASLCNALDALGIAKVTVKTMCAYAVSVGARVSGGTDESVLLRNAAKKYGFSYKTTSKNAELLAHLKAGGVAILHGGSSYKLFSDSGHFVCAVAASGNTVTVLDSFWYSGKYKRNAIRKNYVSVVDDGIIKTSITQCGKATADRSPSYYLIGKVVKKPTTNSTTTAEPKGEYVVKNLEMQVNGSAQTVEAIENDGHNYVRLDQLSKLLPVVVGYNGKQPTMNTAEIKLCIDGKQCSLSGGIIAPGKSLVYVSDLASALGYKVGWDAESKTVTLKMD